jgi:chaperonin GroES
MTRVEMFGSYVLIQRDKPEEKRSPGGIVMPAKSTVNPAWANVISVGPDAARMVSEGDRVLVSKFAGADVVLGDDQCFVVRLEDVYGVERRGD